MISDAKNHNNDPAMTAKRPNKNAFPLSRAHKPAVYADFLIGLRLVLGRDLKF